MSLSVVKVRVQSTIIVWLVMELLISADLPPPFPYMYPLVTGIQNCTVEVDDNDLVVSCQFVSSVLLGYLVVVQFAGSFILLTDESRDDSPVEFEGMNNGLHSVTVFPLTENGIIGTHVAYTEQVLVTLPTTAPPTTTGAPPTTFTTVTPISIPRTTFTNTVPTSASKEMNCNFVGLAMFSFIVTLIKML